jgi:hypothetical protein
MRIAWTTLNGAGLLGLTVATLLGNRAFAEDIDVQSFAVLDPSSTSDTVGTAIASPFKDESAAAPATTGPAQGPGTQPCPPAVAANSACDMDDFVGAPGRFWFRGEYLHWWTTGAHLPPLVSTVDANNPAAETLTTIFGDRDVNDGSHEGYRVNLGMWLDCHHCWAIEGEYFDIVGKQDNFDSGLSNGYSDGIPNPIVHPFYDPSLDPNNRLDPVGVQLRAVAFPLQYVGRVTVSTSDYFQSAGLWLRRQLRASEWSTNNSECNWTDSCARTFRLDAVGGYRFSRLIDAVEVQDSEMSIVPPPYAFYGTQYAFADNSRAVNNFSGAELGLDAVYTHGRWSLDVLGKAAIGVNNQYTRIYGLLSQDSSNTGGGIQQSESTREHSRNRFSAIPELSVTAGYQLTEHVKFTVGYDLLYWSAVVRAANQIAVEPTTGIPYGTLNSANLPNLPAFTFNETYFLAQGLRLGGEIHF